MVVTNLDQILNKVVDASGRLGNLNRELEQTVDCLRETSVRNADSQREEQVAQYRGWHKHFEKWPC